MRHDSYLTPDNWPHHEGRRIKVRRAAGWEWTGVVRNVGPALKGVEVDLCLRTDDAMTIWLPLEECVYRWLP
jgi:hypothetical protein